MIFYLYMRLLDLQEEGFNVKDVVKVVTFILRRQREFYKVLEHWGACGSLFGAIKFVFFFKPSAYLGDEREKKVKHHGRQDRRV